MHDRQTPLPRELLVDTSVPLSVFSGYPANDLVVGADMVEVIA